VSIRFYMDEHVASAITKGLRARGVDVLTAQEDQRGATDDPILLDRAGELGRVLFSQDKDLLAEAVRRQRAGQGFSGLVYAHQARVPIGQCVSDLFGIAQNSQPEDMANLVQYLPLRR
jgi:hypothetical protein